MPSPPTIRAAGPITAICFTTWKRACSARWWWHEHENASWGDPVRTDDGCCDGAAVCGQAGCNPQRADATPTRSSAFGARGGVLLHARHGHVIDVEYANGHEPVGRKAGPIACQACARVDTGFG